MLFCKARSTPKHLHLSESFNRADHSPHCRYMTLMLGNDFPAVVNRTATQPAKRPANRSGLKRGDRPRRRIQAAATEFRPPAALFPPPREPHRAEPPPSRENSLVFEFSLVDFQWKTVWRGPDSIPLSPARRKSPLVVLADRLL
jgi:hypothetical protein